MSKVDWSLVSLKDRQKALRELSNIIGAVPNPKLVQSLLQHLLTPSEIVMIGRRVLIAERLLEEKTYTEIRQELKVGFSTIMVVQKWLDQMQQNQELGLKNMKGKKKDLLKVSTAGTLSSSLRLLGLLVDGYYRLTSAPYRKSGPGY